MKKLGCFRIVILSIVSLWLFSSFLSGTVSAAQIDFPKKPIQVIVGYSPGGAVDIIARGVGKTMSKYLGVPVVVSNMPGAGGIRGLVSQYNAVPDGYTIGMASETPGIPSQILEEKQDFDMNKFTYIGNIQHSEAIWFVKSDSSIRSVKDFKTFGKPVRHGSASLTFGTTIAAMIIAKREGFPLSIVAGYSGSAATILGLIRGEVEFSSCGPSVAMQFVRSGQMRPIVVIGDKRSPNFPDVPTVAELGHPDLVVLASDYYLLAPPRVPKARVQILEDALMKTLKDPEFLKWAKEADVDLKPLNGEGTRNLVLKNFKLLETYKPDIETYMKK